MIFETDRLLIRRIKKEDLPHFHRLQSSRNVMKYVGGKTMTLEENKRDLEKIISLYEQEDNSFWIWAVLLKYYNGFIGTCALVKNEKEEDEIGFRFLKAFWGMGYGKELVKELIAYSFSVLKRNRLVAYVNKENSASVKILEHYFNFVKEYYNEKEQCTERFYELYNNSREQFVINRNEY